jgi:tetratricopeptide (TPR) repeat protein
MKKKHAVFLVCLALTVLTSSAYWNVDKCSFVCLDDQVYVYQNNHVLYGFTKDKIGWAFSSINTANWHPLTWLSHMLDYRIYGLKPAGHHLTSLVFHLLNTLLLFFLLAAMTKTTWRSALVAALFGLHPLHVESVAWVSERKDVLSAFFMLLALLSYVKFVSRKKAPWYVLTILLFACGLMSKPMVVTLPFVLLLLDFWPLNRFALPGVLRVYPEKPGNTVSVFHLVLEKIPFFLLSAASCIIALVSQRAGGAVVSFVALPLRARLYNAALSYVEYIEKMLWPFNLSFFYPYRSPEPHVFLMIGISIAVLLLATLVTVLLIKKRPYVLVGWLWFLGTLVPVIGIIQIGAQAMADRYAYIPLIGLFIMAAWLFADMARHGRFGKIITVTASLAVLLFLTHQTRKQTGYWENNLTLAEHGLKVMPENSLAYSIKGNYLLSKNRLEEAKACFTKAISLCPSEQISNTNIGMIYLIQRNYKEAIIVFRGIIARDSLDLLANLNCGTAYLAAQDLPSALSCYLRAFKADSTHLPTLYNLGHIYERKQDYPNAIRYYRMVLKVKPGDADAYGRIRECSVLQDKDGVSGKNAADSTGKKPSRGHDIQGPGK